MARGEVLPRLSHHRVDAETAVRHLHYVEPFAGSLAVLLARDPEDPRLCVADQPASKRGVSEVVNDLHGDLTTFWRVLQRRDSFEEFRRLVEAVPFSGVEWVDAAARLEEDGDGPVERAAAFFVCNRQSLAGRMDTFAAITRNRTRSGMNEQASA